MVNIMKRYGTALRVMALALLAVPVVSMAQTTEPSNTRPANREEPLSPRRGGLGGLGGPAQVGPVSDKEMEAVADFMAKYAPNRWKALDQLPDDGGLRHGVMNFVVARYRQLKEVREEDERLYDIKVKQLVAEDEIYGLVMPLKSPTERESHRDDIKAAVRKLLTLNQEERERRTERTRQALESEERRLTSERDHMDQLVDSRTSALIVDGASALRREVRRGESEPMRRPGGLGNPPTTQHAPRK